ncbi:MAG: cyanoexosortase B system-associated protein [Chloroflexaceae bacterium]|nr:cyanoexosortase B system-associated protein [Chloroflexaceae bacterium]
METSKSKNKGSFLYPIQVRRLLLTLMLSLLVIVAALPGYWRGWSWWDLPKVANIEQLTRLRKVGLTLPGWETLVQERAAIGGHDWSVQVLAQNDRQILLLLLPQVYYRNQPEVEWNDVAGAQRWRSDSYQTLSFSPAGNHSPIPARFFRAWTQRQTFAVVQWYAWPGGGHYAPARWFWRDQFAQIRRQRLPWVAVCLKIPIEPLGELEPAISLATSLAEQVQSALNDGPFAQP